MTEDLNTGHGHVRPRPDGVKARCGGPALCGVCARERAVLDGLKPPEPPARSAEVQAWLDESTRVLVAELRAKGWPIDDYSVSIVLTHKKTLKSTRVV